MKYLKLLIIIILSFYMFSCDIENKKITEKKKYDRFDDYYKDNVYINNKLGFFITFDKDWVIIADYEQFNNFQKQYAKYFSSNHGEVLFIGFNDKKKIGIRATCEVLGLTNEEYYDKIKSVLAEEAVKYKIAYQESSEVLLKNLKAYHSVCSAEINKNNIFVFDSAIFTLELNNFKIDTWTKNTNYENQKEYIYSIFDQIDIKAKEENK